MVLVKIDGAGCYEIDDSLTDLFNELSADVVAASEADDVGVLRERLDDLTCFVVAAGEPVSGDAADSNCRHHIPEVDATPAEVRLRLQEFTSPAVVA